MSNVTDLILVHDPADADTAVALQAEIAASGWFRSTGLVRVDHHVGQSGIPMESVIHIAGFNHLDEPALIERVRRAPWRAPARVQLLIQRQDDLNFEEIDLLGDRLPGELLALAAGKAMTLAGPPAQGDFIGGRGSRFVIVEPWIFAVLRIHQEKWFGSDRRQMGTHMELTSHALLTADCAYRGQAARFTCDRAIVGEARYKQVRKVLEEVNDGDAIEFAGNLHVDESGIWQLTDPTMIHVSR